MMKRTIPTTEAEWRSYLSRLVKAHLGAVGMNYADLARELKKMGVPTYNKLISSKLRIGNFSAQFLLQSPVAMGVEELELPRKVQED